MQSSSTYNERNPDKTFTNDQIVENQNIFLSIKTKTLHPSVHSYLLGTRITQVWDDTTIVLNPNNRQSFPRRALPPPTETQSQAS
jgi:hypothetical protein